MSADQVVVASVYDGERSEIYTSLERDDRLGHAVVRLSGAGDAPMSPAQALSLAAALTTAAFSAVSSWGGAR